jgi:hypothetical protein
LGLSHDELPSLKNQIAFHVTVLLLALAFCGCPHRIQPLTAAQRLNDPQAFLEVMRNSSARLQSLRAVGYADIRKGGRRIKAHILAVAQRPAWLRFETESFFDQPLSILTTDGMAFSLWDMDKGRFLIGQATPANISRVIPIPLDGPEVTGILLGDPPLIPYAQLDLFWDNAEQLYRLILMNSRQKQEVRIEPTSLRPVQVVCYDSGKLWYQLSFEDWSGKPGGPRAPQTIQFVSPHDDVNVLIHIRQVEVNLQLDQTLFQLKPPSGIPLESID